MPTSRPEFETLLQEKVPSTGRRQVTATDMRDVLLTLLENTLFPDELGAAVAEVTGPLVTRLDQLEAAIAVLAEGGDLVAPAVISAAAIEPAAPQPGDDVTIVEPVFDDLALEIARTITLGGVDVSAELVELTLPGASVGVGLLVLEWIATGLGGLTATARLEIAIGTPASVVTAAAFAPAAPVHGQEVELLAPVVEGSGPLVVELVSVTNAGIEPAIVNEGGRLFVTVSEGALRAEWRVTGPLNQGAAAIASVAEVTVAAVAAPYTPNIVRSENMQIAVATTAPPAGEEKPVLVIAGSIASMTEGSLGNSFAWRSTDAAGTSEVRLNNSGGLLAQIGFATSTGTGVTVSGGGSSVAGDRNGFVVVVRKSGDIKVYRQVSGGAPFLIDSDSIASSVTVPGAGSAMTLLGDNRIIETSGIGVWELDAVPDILENWGSFIDADGYSAGREAASAALGAEPLIGEWGNAAAWADTAHDGADPGAVTVSGSGAFSDVALPAEIDGEVVHSAAQLMDGSYLAAPNISSPYFDDGDNLAARLSIKKHRAGPIMPNECMFFEIEGFDYLEWITYGVRWEFGLTGQFLHTPGVEYAHRQKDFGLGPNAMAAWDDPAGGEQTVRAIITPPAYTGKKGCILQTTVPIDALNSIYSASNTVVIARPDGTSAGAPVGTVVPDLPAAVAAAKQMGADARIRFASGSTTLLEDTGFNTDRQFAGISNRLLLDNWGGSGSDRAKIHARASLDLRRTDGPTSYVVNDLDFFGMYDPATGLGERTIPFNIDPIAHHTFNRVRSYGNKQLIEGTKANERIGDSSLMVYDSDITKWDHYGLGIIGRVAYFGVHGCGGRQDPNAVNGLEAKQSHPNVNFSDHACIRTGEIDDCGVYVGGCDFLGNNGWTTGPDAPNGDQRMSDQGQRYGGNLARAARGNFTGNLVEGGGFSLDGGGAARVYAGTKTNVSQNIFVMTTNSSGSITLGHSGMGIHDNIFFVPRAPVDHGGSVKIVTSNQEAFDVDPSWVQGSWDIFSNTFVLLLLQSDVQPDRYSTYDELFKAQFTSWKTSAVAHTTEFPVERHFNNLVHSPNYTLKDEVNPRDLPYISMEGQLTRDMIYKGIRMFINGGLFTDPATALPADTVRLPYPGEGVPEATGFPFDSALDFFGRPKTASPIEGGVQRVARVI